MDAGAERLGEGFLGGKTLGEVRRGFLVHRESLQFALAQDAPRKPLAKARERLLDARDLHHVRADAVDHRAACTISCFISRTASRMPTKTARDTMAWPICSSRTPGSAATGCTLK